MKKPPSPPKTEGFAHPQMTLFQTFFCEDQKAQLSNTIELWDAIPKYSVSRQRQSRLRNAAGGLDPVTMNFQHRGQSYVMTLYPAKVLTREQKWIEFFPTEKEELVEDALRKLATEKGLGFLDDHGAGVTFTARELLSLLARHKHGIHYYDLINALEILRRTGIKIALAGEQKFFFDSSILTELGTISREDWRKDPSAKWYARFNSLIEACIRAQTYRQFDFAQMMAHSSQLARWLYKRMAHLYLQASITDPYRISLTTVKRDSGLLNASSLRFDARSLEKALSEMKTQGVLVDIQQERRYGPRKTLIDALYVLTPHPRFIRHVKLANKRAQWLKETP
jgi:hypothetical protein